MILGTVDPMNVPDATRVMGLAAMSPRRLRVLGVHRGENSARERAAGRTRRGAGHRHHQLPVDPVEGDRCDGTHERTAGDMALVHHHIDTFCEASPQVGLTPDSAVRFFSLDVAAIVLDVDDLYDQTPGPGAGRRIVASR